MTNKHVVIIPVFNELPTVSKMLSAYIKNTDLNLCTTYIVDDGGDQNAAKYLLDFCNKHVLNYFRNPKNIGKPKSVNNIIHQNREASAFTIIDSDLVIKTHNWNRLLDKAHKIFKYNAILGAKLNLTGYEFQKSGMTFGDLFPFWTLPGGFFSIPSSVFKRLGYFYDKIRRHEDADYCRRAATQNIRWYYTSDIEVKLLPHKSFADNLAYARIKLKEEDIYKKRAVHIMRTHDVYYKAFLN